MSNTPDNASQSTLIGYLTTASAMISAVKDELQRPQEDRLNARLFEAHNEIERLKKLCRDKDDELNQVAFVHERELDHYKLAQNKNETELEEKAKVIAEYQGKLAFVTKRVGDIEAHAEDLASQISAGDRVIAACKLQIENKCQELRDADKKIEQFKYQAHLDKYQAHLDGKSLVSAREDIARLNQCIRDKDSAINSTVRTFQEAERRLLCHKAERQSDAISHALVVKDLKQKLEDRDAELKAATSALAGGTERLGAQLCAEQVKSAALEQKLRELQAASRPDLATLLGPESEHYGARILPIFWRACDYKTFEEARQQGAVYYGEYVSGLSALRDTLANAARCCDCFDHNAGNEMRARIIVGGFDYDVNRNCETV